MKYSSLQCKVLPLTLASLLRQQEPSAEGQSYFSHRTWQAQPDAELEASSLLESFHSAEKGKVHYRERKISLYESIKLY